MQPSSENKGYLVAEPETTPSILANIPDCLRNVLRNSSRASNRKKRAILISSNSLANRFILERWGIRPSQRRRFRNLFSSVRKQCRSVFQHVLARGRFEWDFGRERFVFGVYKFDEIRGNVILGFVEVSPEAEWTLPS
ncbi:MAG: hypothetical protein KAQ65_08490 [Candidatus Thorarchaeota archaeon]|nr:hypothetical protein [Candidatus Thorarchaeota archaeon]